MEPTVPQVPHSPHSPQSPTAPVATAQPSAGLSRAQVAVTAWARQQAPRMWWKVALGGIVAWVIVDSVASGTPDGPVLALDLLIGAALIPFCFLLYWYEECGEARLPSSVLGWALVAGGTVGLLCGALIENALNPASNWPGAIVVGIAEEIAKALAIVIIARYFYAQVPHRLHGLLVGVAVGAGFAAVETLGYGLTSLLQASQQVDISTAVQFANQELLARLVLSPFGHVVWAGIMGAAIWRERKSNQFVLDKSVFQAFIIVVVLHAIWDGTLFAGWASLPIGGLTLPIVDTFIVGPVGLITLAFFVYEARARERMVAAPPLPPLPPLFDALRNYYRHLGVFLGIIADGPRIAPALPMTQRATIPPTPPVVTPPPAAHAQPTPQPTQPVAQRKGVFCTQCGTHNTAEAKFCINCGSQLPVLPNRS